MTPELYDRAPPFAFHDVPAGQVQQRVLGLPRIPSLATFHGHRNG